MTSPRRRPAGAVAIVTGAAGATGRSVLRTLAEQGVVVVALDASVQGLADEEDLYPGQVLPFTADVTAPGAAACAVALVAERLGAPQILVHLAGQLTRPAMGKLTESMWGLERALHVDAGVEFTRAVLPLMDGAGWGRVVHVVDAHADAVGDGRDSYRSSRSALVECLEHSAASAPRGVTVNVLLCGRSAAEAPGVDETTVANAVAFLVSEDARGVSGRHFSVVG